MQLLNRSNGKTRPVAWLALVCGMLAVAWAWQHQWYGQLRTVNMTGWDIPRLVSYLNERGVRVSSVSTMALVEDPYSAFLTTTDLGFEELNALPRSKQQIDRWRGVVYCEVLDPRSRRAADVAFGMEDYSMVRGHFSFVGDPDLLRRIAAALSQAN